MSFAPAYSAILSLAMLSAFISPAKADEVKHPFTFKVRFAVLLNDGPKLIGEISCKSGEDCYIYGSQDDQMNITVHSDDKARPGEISVHCRVADCFLGNGRSSFPITGEEQSFYISQGPRPSGLEIRYGKTLGRLIVKCLLPGSQQQ